jgi:hypothetical protein
MPHYPRHRRPGWPSSSEEGHAGSVDIERLGLLIGLPLITFLSAFRAGSLTIYPASLAPSAPCMEPGNGLIDGLSLLDLEERVRRAATAPRQAIEFHLECGGQRRNRTADASLFRAALYQLSYLAITLRGMLPGRNLKPLYPKHPTFHAGCNCSSAVPVVFSTSACRLLPCASMVTMAGKPFTRRCHIASGIPNSIRLTSRTSSTVLA